MECAFIVSVTWSCCQETFWPQLVGQFEPLRSTIGKSGWLLYLKFICPHFACYHRVFLNVCFSYTSRHEITESIRTLVQGAAEGMIYPRSGICSLLPPHPPLPLICLLSPNSSSSLFLILLILLLHLIFYLLLLFLPSPM